MVPSGRIELPTLRCSVNERRCLLKTRETSRRFFTSEPTQFTGLVEEHLLAGELGR